MNRRRGLSQFIQCLVIVVGFPIHDQTCPEPIDRQIEYALATKYKITYLQWHFFSHHAIMNYVCCWTGTNTAAKSKTTAQTQIQSRYTVQNTGNVYWKNHRTRVISKQMEKYQKPNHMECATCNWYGIEWMACTPTIEWIKIMVILELTQFISFCNLI